MLTHPQYSHFFIQLQFRKCHNSTPLPLNKINYENNIPLYVINLNLSPEIRWKQLVTDLKPQIHAFVQHIRANIDKTFGKTIFHLIDDYLPLLLQTLPEEYYKELLGISNATELPVGEVTLFNVFYEFNSLCTSIVMEDSSGSMYHGRNLDFGFMLGWDSQNSTWLVTEYLRPLIVKVDFQRNHKSLFTSVNFGGYIGVLTGLKKNAFSLSVNERFKLNGGYVGIIEWILGHRNQKWNGILTREVMEKASSYTEAQKMLILPKLLAPTYFILTGNKSAQGCVITRGRHDVNLWFLRNYENTPTSWYLVQTNYDHWKPPPPLDNRRVPAIICLELFGQENAVFTLYNVMSTVPVLNKLTVYSAIMHPISGSLDVWIQNCGDSCWPW